MRASDRTMFLNLHKLKRSHILFGQNLPKFNTTLKKECNGRQAPNLTVIKHSQFSNLKPKRV